MKLLIQPCVTLEERIAKQFLTPKPPCWSIPGRRKVLSVACGELHLVVVARMDGMFESDVYSAGHNGFGQQGVSGVIEIHELTPVRFILSCD
jgi:alpha-tubulin suppressor-like RCC1 family protein